MLKIFYVLFILLIFIFNCKTTSNAPRLEKWSSMIESEKEIYGDSMKEFGKLTPIVERSQFDNNPIPDEYNLIYIRSLDLAQFTCDDINDKKVLDSKLIIQKLDEFIFSNNVDLAAIEKNFNYTNKIDASYSCFLASKENQILLDDILIYLRQIMNDMDNPKKQNRKNRFLKIQNRIKFYESDNKKVKTELLLKEERIKEKNHELYVDAYEEAGFKILIADTTFFVSYILSRAISYSSYNGVFRWVPLTVMLGASGYKFFSPTAKDDRKIQNLTSHKNLEVAFQNVFLTETLFKDNLYILMNDKKTNLQSFDEFEASINFQITNFEELYRFHLMKQEFVLRTKKIQEICKKYECDKKADIVQLQKSAKEILEELKIRKNTIQYR